MTTGLVISGGGDKGAFAVGVIEVLLDRGFRFDVISGTSTGALIAPLVAIDDAEELVRLYTTVCRKDILRYNWRRLFRDAIFDTKPLENLIRRVMTRERYEKLLMCSVQVLLCSVGFQTGNIYYLSQRDSDQTTSWGDFNGFVKAVLASTNQPMLMPPINILNQQCFDGGVKEVAPLSVVQKMGVEEIVVIANSPSTSLHGELYLNLSSIGPRAIDLFTEEILNNDIQAKSADCNVTVIRPEVMLPTSGLEFKPAVMKKMREEGKKRAQEVLC